MAALQKMTGFLALVGAFAAETLTGTRTLTFRDSATLVLDPGGADRDVNLPSVGKSHDGACFCLGNSADAAEDLVVKDAAGSTVVTVKPETEAMVYVSASGAWTLLSVRALGASVAPNLPVEIADPGDAASIAVTHPGVCHLVTAGAETRTLADPTRVGQRMALYFLTDGGNCVITVASPINVAGNNTITFADVGEFVELVSARDGAAAYHWHVVGSDLNNGTLSTV
jgi:hypothetical protein